MIPTPCVEALTVEDKPVTDEKQSQKSVLQRAWCYVKDFIILTAQPNLTRFWLNREPTMLVMAVLVGIGAGYAAVLFREAIGFVQWLWSGTRSEGLVEAVQNMPGWIVFFAPVTGGVLVGLYLHFIMPGRRCHGAADVIEAKALLNSKIPLKTGLGSALVTVLSLGFGGSAGREGPVVHLGATITGFLQDKLSLPPASRRILLACGVASAVSASFNVPIAGILFAHEVILQHFAMRAFVPIAISSVIGAVIIRYHFGDIPIFSVPEYQMVTMLEYPAFAVLGLVCALVAILFQFMIISSDTMARQVRMPLWLRPIIGGILVGLIALKVPEILGVGYDSTNGALNQKFVLSTLLLLLGVKILATSITLASRFGGGVFSPSLYLGAMAGGAFGIVAGSLYPTLASGHGLYAIAGMGAVAAAILGAPISTTMIAFELTQDYHTAINIILAVSIATILHQAVHGKSLFHWQLANRGIFLNEGAHQSVMLQMRVKDFLTPLKEGEEVDPFDPDDETLYYLTPSDSIETALRIFDLSGFSRLAVFDPKQDDKILGWADQVTALHELNQALIRASSEEHA